MSNVLAPIEARSWRVSPPASADHLYWIGLLLAYGVIFTLLRSAAQWWATHELFSLWFPAAGLRFALLWWAGPQKAPAIAFSELIVSVGTGTVEIGAAPGLAILGIVGPCLVYGLVIYGVRKRHHARLELPWTDPMPLAIAALLGPIAACLAALPWAVPLALEEGHLSGQALLSSLLVFSLGDMLGILLLAPPILWLLQKRRSGSLVQSSRARIIEAIAVLILGLSLVLLMRWLGYGLQLAPLVVAAGWIGFRTGRMAAWLAVLLISLITLPLTTATLSETERVTDHMLLLSIIAAGYLAGSYADAQALAAAEISRRDRLLYQADRLKTLRAMSVAVIHELSQPLSTISLEASGLLSTTSRPDFDAMQVREMAEIIARKSSDLAQLVARLRQFGERGSEAMALVPASVILNGGLQTIAGEARSLNVAVEALPGKNVAVMGSEIELRQVLINLLRNGIAAAAVSSKVIQAGWKAEEGQISFFICNDSSPSKQTQGGMGIGLIIARAIARAHAGNVGFEYLATDKVVTTLVLPIVEQ